jgi:hypothetical protein
LEGRVSPASRKSAASGETSPTIGPRDPRRGTLPAAGSRIDNALQKFKEDENITGKGRLSQMVYLSRVARIHRLPLNKDEWLTGGGGQIRGASGAAAQKVLNDYGIVRVLSSEGGRTSRGSLGYVSTYIDLLNSLHATGDGDTGAIEAWWVDRVRDFFNATPFELRFDPGKNLRAVVRDLMEQAMKRQQEMPGAQLVGTLLQHLVGAKLELCLPNKTINHHNSSAADAPGGRAGDFLIENAAIHVTTAPGDPLMHKCKENLRTGTLHPIVLTTSDRMAAAHQSAEMAGIRDRVEILDVEQFIATNLLELGGFAAAARRLKVGELIDRYNTIIDSAGEDPSLKISP